MIRRVVLDFSPEGNVHTEATRVVGELTRSTPEGTCIHLKVWFTLEHRRVSSPAARIAPMLSLPWQLFNEWSELLPPLGTGPCHCPGVKQYSDVDLPFLSWACFFPSRVNWLEWNLGHGRPLESCFPFLVFLANPSFHPLGRFSMYFVPGLYVAQFSKCHTIFLDCQI